MLIALTGYWGVGKNTFFESVKSKYPVVQKLSLFDEVRYDCQAFLDKHFPGRYDLTDQEDLLKWMPLLVTWRDTCNNQSKNNIYWIERLYTKHKEIFENKRCIKIIVDCNYFTELRWVAARDGAIIRINKKDVAPQNQSEAKNFERISKAKLPIIDLDNNYDLITYKHQCIEVFERLLVEKGVIA